MPKEDRSFLGDVGSVWTRRKQIWKLVSRADKLGFSAGVLIMTVVAAVETGIALLIGILLPALSKARSAGQIAKCLANCRQMGLIMTLAADARSHARAVQLDELYAADSSVVPVPAWRSRA